MSANTLASRLPGRLRLRDRALRGHALHDGLMAQLRALPGVLSLEGNPATGSILLHYDVAQMAQADMEARVMAAAASVLGTDEVAPANPRIVADPSTPARRALARRLNRYSKIGMMGSLALSLAALAGSKRMHAGAGGLFVALMLVHMAVHRRHLLK